MGAVDALIVGNRKLGKTRRGFTLIELLVVVAIISILAAILIPNFMHARAESQTTGCLANEKQIATAVEEYAVDHGASYGAGGSVTSTLLGAVYLSATPHDPVNSSTYSLITTGGGTYGSYQVTDAGGHDTTTTNGLSGGPGTGSIVYNQNSGFGAK
jgi:prepilin-type N-terminal cleavage/methylation domain-containing protein